MKNDNLKRIEIDSVLRFWLYSWSTFSNSSCCIQLFYSTWFNHQKLMRQVRCKTSAVEIVKRVNTFMLTNPVPVKNFSSMLLLLLLLLLFFVALTEQAQINSGMGQCRNIFRLRSNLLSNTDSRGNRSIMTLDPTNKEQIKTELLICDKRKGANAFHDWAILCYEIILNMSQYLTPYETMIFRRLTRWMIIGYLMETREILYRSLSPQITQGFECLLSSSLSACVSMISRSYVTRKVFLW